MMRLRPALPSVLLMAALLLAILLRAVPAAAQPAFPPVATPPVPADTVLSAQDREATVALITARLNLAGGDTAAVREYLPLFDDATSKWPAEPRAEARARIEPLLTPEQAEAFRLRYLSRQSDATLAQVGAWLRDPLVEMVLARQVEADPDSLLAFLRRVDSEGYPPHLEARLPLMEAMVEEIRYHDLVVNRFHRTMTLFAALTNAYEEEIPLEAIELYVASEGAQQARREVRLSVRTHQFLYRDRPDSDIERYTDALRSEAGQALLTLRRGVDTAREEGFNALVLDQAGIQPSTWRPEAASDNPEAVRRDRVRVLLVSTGLAGLVQTVSNVVTTEVTAATLLDEDALRPGEHAVLAEVFADAFAPARNVDQIAHTLAATVADSTLDAFEAWAADSLLSDVFADYLPVVERKRWDTLKFTDRDARLLRVDDALGFSSFMMGLYSEASWAVFSETKPQAIDAAAVQGFRAQLADETEEVWKQVRMDALYEFGNALHHVSDAKLDYLAKRLRDPEAQAFLGWSYAGIRRVFAEATTQALRRAAIYAERGQPDGER
ncbi:MAG: hypothetical protein AAFV01_04035 [Bacteroidota bacterium]